MKNLKSFGKPLSKHEMKSVKGGFNGPCNGSSYNCPNACITHPNLTRGEVCMQNTCYVMACP